LNHAFRKHADGWLILALYAVDSAHVRTNTGFDCHCQQSGSPSPGTCASSLRCFCAVLFGSNISLALRDDVIIHYFHSSLREGSFVSFVEISVFTAQMIGPPFGFC
jgi:hypothetical protein